MQYKIKSAKTIKLIPAFYALVFSFVLCILIISPNFICAQIGGIQKADSLLAIFPHSKTERQRVDILNAISAIYMNIKPKVGISHAYNALSLAEKNNYPVGMADAYINLGTSTLVSNIAGNREDAYKWLSLARAISSKTNYKTGLGRIYFWEAMLSLNNSDYAGCLESVNHAKSIFEETRNHYDLVAVYDVLAILYFQIKDVKKGAEMVVEGLEMAEKFGNFIFKSEMLYQYGYYVKLISENNPQEALKYYTLALENSEKFGLNTYSSTVMGYIAHVYTKRKEYQTAIDYYQKSIDIEEKNEIEFSNGWAIYNIGRLYLKMAQDSAYLLRNGKPAEGKTREDYLRLAIDFSEKALESARKRSERDYMYYIYFVISEAYKSLGNYKMARDYYKLTRTMQNSITSIENQRELTRVEEKLLKAVQNKEMEIENRILANNIMIIVFLALLLAGIAVMIFLVNRDQQKVRALLLNILPPSIAVRLTNKEKPIADYFEKVTVVFINIVNFTPLLNHLSPVELVRLLNNIYTEFDRITSKYGLEKIKTIGDCYMVAGGLPEPMPEQVQAAAMFAVEASQVLAEKRIGEGYNLTFRCGIDCGPVVAGVIGEKKFIYDLWSDTVNTAARMEQTSETGKIQVTERFKTELESGYSFKLESHDPDDKFRSFPVDFEFIARGQIPVKGKGAMNTWFMKEKEGD